MIEAYPLQWPAGWPRNQDPEYSRFTTGSAYFEGKEIVRQLELMGATNIVINSNMMLRNDGVPYARQNVSDTGVAVYFTLKGKQQCIPCDRWVKLEENMKAVSKTIDALRGIERWGAKETVDAAFSGFKALPAGSGNSMDTYTKSWWEILQVSKDASKDEIRTAFRRLAHQCHPDKGGSEEAFKTINQAFQEGMQ